MERILFKKWESIDRRPVCEIASNTLTSSELEIAFCEIVAKRRTDGLSPDDLFSLPFRKEELFDDTIKLQNEQIRIKIKYFNEIMYVEKY